VENLLNLVFVLISHHALVRQFWRQEMSGVSKGKIIKTSTGNNYKNNKKTIKSILYKLTFSLC
jgi:hypothetical protein